MAIVTITSPDGSTRTEDGRGKVLSRTPATSSSPSSSSSSSSSKKSSYSPSSNEENRAIMDAYEEETGEKIYRTSSSDRAKAMQWYAEQSGSTGKSSSPSPSAAPRTLPEGAKEVKVGSATKIAYGGLYYEPKSFYGMQASGQKLGAYDSSVKEEKEYQYVKGQVRDEYYTIEETKYPVMTDASGFVYAPIEMYEGEIYQQGPTPVDTKKAWDEEGPDVFTPPPGGAPYDVEAAIVKEATEAGRSVKKSSSGKMVILPSNITSYLEARAPVQEIKVTPEPVQFEGQFQEGGVYAPLESFFDEKSSKVSKGSYEVNGVVYTDVYGEYNMPSLDPIFVVQGGAKVPFTDYATPSKVETDLITGEATKYYDIPISFGDGADRKAAYDLNPKFYLSQMGETSRAVENDVWKGVAKYRTSWEVSPLVGGTPIKGEKTFAGFYTEAPRRVQSQELSPYEYEFEKAQKNEAWELLGFKQLEQRGQDFSDELWYSGRLPVTDPLTKIAVGAVAGSVQGLTAIPMMGGTVVSAGAAYFRTGDDRKREQEWIKANWETLPTEQKMHLAYNPTQLYPEKAPAWKTSFDDWTGVVGANVAAGQYGTALEYAAVPVLTMVGTVAITAGLTYGASAAAGKVAGKVRGFKGTIEGIEYGLTSPGDDIATRLSADGKTAYSFATRGVGDVSLAHGRIKGFTYGGDVLSYSEAVQVKGSVYQVSYGFRGGKVPYNLPDPKAGIGTPLGTPYPQSYRILPADMSATAPIDTAWMGKTIKNIHGVKGDPFGGAFQGDRWIKPDASSLDAPIRATKYIDEFVRPPVTGPDGFGTYVSPGQQGLRTNLLGEMVSGKFKTVGQAYGMEGTFLYDKAGKLAGYSIQPMGITSMVSGSEKGVAIGYLVQGSGTSTPFRGAYFTAKAAPAGAAWTGPVLKGEDTGSMVMRKLGLIGGKSTTQTITSQNPMVFVPPSAPVGGASLPSGVKTATQSIAMPASAVSFAAYAGATTKGYRVTDYDVAFGSGSPSGIRGVLLPDITPGQDFRILSPSKGITTQLPQVDDTKIFTSPITGQKPILQPWVYEKPWVGIIAPPINDLYPQIKTSQPQDLKIGNKEATITGTVTTTTTDSILEFIQTPGGGGKITDPVIPIIPVIPILPFFDIGFGRSEGGSKGRASKQMYKASVVGAGFTVFPKVVISKAPTFVGGGGIRGILEPKKKKKKTSTKNLMGGKKWLKL